MTRAIGLATVSTLLALAACSGGNEPQANANAQGNDVAAPPAPAGNQTAPAARALSAIPEPFYGRWDFALDYCGDAASEGALTIAADRIEYYESEARVAEIATSAPGAITVTGEFSGEGQSWRERIGYELNTAGDRLTTTAEDGSVSARMRCP
ncbi:MAG: hypothetical protein H7X93_10115 [Sphingomonadaceae bacterium]|nr:hypothetical protein [Sphingomonadaceae bacterium]